MNALSFESSDAVIDESFIEGEVIPQLEKNQRRIQQHQDRINGVVDSVSDIVSLPKIDTSAIQTGIHEAKQHAMNTVEKLYAFDYAQSAAVDQLISLMAPISSFIDGLNGAIESGVSITALAGYIASQDVPPEIKAMHPMLNGTYNVLTPYQNFNDQAVHTQNFLLSPNPFGFIHFSNPFIANVAHRFYLASGNIDVVHHYSPDHQIAGTTVDANGNEIQDVSKMGQGEIINDWGNGHVEVKGEYVDIEALKDAGVRVHTFTTVSGKELHYTVENGEFIFFRNEPNVHYYTNGYTQTKVNSFLARGTMFFGAIATYHIAKSFRRGEYKSEKEWKKLRGQGLDSSKTNKDKTIMMEEVKDKTLKDFALDHAKNAIIGTLPIIGTEFPNAGEQEILIWLSEDEGETWDTKVYVKVNSNGAVTIEDYEERKPSGIIGKVVDFFTDDNDKK